jgi:tripartite-type tricarboxylate transporter receptor subunit TctC
MKATRLATAVLLAGLASVAAAQYPNKPVRIINPFAVGGTGDIITRSVAQKIAEATGKPIVVENRTGAGGRIGYEAVIRSPADGYTLVLSDTTFTMMPALYRNLPWSGSDVLAPVTILAETPFVIVTIPTVRASTLKELIGIAKSQPGRINYGSAGAGSVNHVSTELFRREAGVDITHLPYKGMSDAITGMLTGSIDMLVVGVFIAAPHVKSGKLVPLAVAATRRSSALPDVPSTAEAGLPRFVAGNWFGWSAPKGTPNDAVDWLYREARTALSTSAVKELLAAQGAEASGITPEQFANVIRDDTQRWGEVIRATGINAD